MYLEDMATMFEKTVDIAMNIFLSTLDSSSDTVRVMTEAVGEIPLNTKNPDSNMKWTLNNLLFCEIGRYEGG